MSFKLGVGEFEYSECIDPAGANRYWRLKYVSKDNNPCGPYYTLSINEENVEDGNVRIYPNPAVDHIIIETNYYPVNVIMKDLTGRKVYEYSVSQTQNKLDVRNVPTGVYLLQLRDALGRVSNHKIIIAR